MYSQGQKKNNEIRKMVENIFLELIATIFVISVVYLCFRILFKS
jgi:hypothetical protein